MSQITLVFGIAPALAPIVGGVLLNLLGWRAIFWVLLAWTVLCSRCARACCRRRCRVAQRHALHPRALWRNYRAVLTRPEFLLLALIPALNFCAFFLYIAAAPGVPGRPARRVDVGLRVAVRADDRRHHDRRVRCPGASPVACRRSARSASATRCIAPGVLLNLAVCTFLPPYVAWNVLPILIYTIGSAASSCRASR